MNIHGDRAEMISMDQKNLSPHTHVPIRWCYWPPERMCVEWKGHSCAGPQWLFWSDDAGRGVSSRGRVVSLQTLFVQEWVVVINGEVKRNVHWSNFSSQRRNKPCSIWRRLPEAEANRRAGIQPSHRSDAFDIMVYSIFKN
jgi:hypothetical protein